MSLDFYLIQPHKCEACGHLSQDGEEVFWANITHNLNVMAGEAGIYDCLWRPDENDYHFAWELIDELATAIVLLKASPSHYRQFDAENGWGTYDKFLPWLEKVLEACREHPEARIKVSR